VKIEPSFSGAVPSSSFRRNLRIKGEISSNSLFSSETSHACPKTYELRLQLFLARIAAFQDGYLTSGRFVGSHFRGRVELVRSL